MTRKLCLIAFGLQVILFAFLFCVSRTDVFVELVDPNAELIFKIVSFTLIFLFPFGMASFFLSMTFILMWKMNAFPAKFKQQIVEGRAPIVFFVWKEIRERLNIYKIGEDK